MFHSFCHSTLLITYHKHTSFDSSASPLSSEEFLVLLYPSRWRTRHLLLKANSYTKQKKDWWFHVWHTEKNGSETERVPPPQGREILQNQFFFESMYTNLVQARPNNARWPIQIVFGLKTTLIYQCLLKLTHIDYKEGYKMTEGVDINQQKKTSRSCIDPIHKKTQRSHKRAQKKTWGNCAMGWTLRCLHNKNQTGFKELWVALGVPISHENNIWWKLCCIFRPPIKKNQSDKNIIAFAFSWELPFPTHQQLTEMDVHLHVRSGVVNMVMANELLLCVVLLVPPPVHFSLSSFKKRLQTHMHTNNAVTRGLFVMELHHRERQHCLPRVARLR